MAEKTPVASAPADYIHLEKGPAHALHDPKPVDAGRRRESKTLEEVRTAEVDAFIEEMERQLEPVAKPPSFFRPTFRNPQHYTYIMVIFASMGGMLIGLDDSLISGANLTMPADLGLTSRQSSLVTSLMAVGAIFGALAMGPANEYLGRRGTIIASLCLFTIGAALEAGAIDFGMMVAGRLVLGFGLGTQLGTVVIYVSESVSPKIRGNLVSLYQFNIALGEVLGFVVAAIFIKFYYSWRYILGSSLVFSTIMFCGMLFMPDSPRYLMHKGKVVEAFAVWKRIRGVNTAEDRSEFYIMNQSAEEEKRDHEERRKSLGRPVVLDFIFVPRCRRAFVYCNLMMFFGQFVGINGLMYYMSILMTQIGFNNDNAAYMSLVGSGSLLLGTIPAILFMERFGRRFWANATIPCFFIGLVLIAIAYCIPLNPKNLQSIEGLYLSGVILYFFFYGPYACLTWVLPGEVYPTYIRSYGMMISDAAVNLFVFIITYNFTSMQIAMTKQGLTLGFFGGFAVLAWFFQVVFMPETKNLTLEEIEQVFDKPTKQRCKENIQNSIRTAKNMLMFRWGAAFSNFGYRHALEGNSA